MTTSSNIISANTNATHKTDNIKSAEILAADGPFSDLLPDYHPRSGQREMASLVEATISSGKPLVIEAPSGSGKTLAYLVPVMSAGKKAIVSTATQYLQDQLFLHDIALVQKALQTDRSVAVLKGRNSYVCPYYLEKILNGKGGISTKIRLQLTLLWQRFRTSSQGYWAQLLPELEPAALPYATCSAEACLGQLCPVLSRCPLMQARSRADKADIVIVNHSLLFSDQVMRCEQLVDLLPLADVIIVDEAHRLTDYAQTIVGHRLSSRQLKAYCRDAIEAVTRLAADQRWGRDFLRQLEAVIDQLCNALPVATPYDNAQHLSVVSQLAGAFDKLCQWSGRVSERAQPLQELAIRTKLIQKKLHSIQHYNGLCQISATVHGFMIQNIPLNPSAFIKALFAKSHASWVFTSATLCVSDNASVFLQHLGLSAEHFYRVSSPIDYRNNMALYTPRLPVDPVHPDYSQHLSGHALKLLELIKGKTLFLFTSHAMLQNTSTWLKNHAEKPLFVQGTLPNAQLIMQFKRSDNGILLGTGSFWEGLDLSGVPLSAVIIDKIPFACPDDPLVKLRCEHLMANGINSFEHYLLPDAVIRLRQGCGRLLRRLSDKGVIMIADPRLHSKSYGAVFIDSLPAMLRSNHLAPLRQFLRHQCALTKSK